MTIELDTTIAQAEVLFLSFAQLVADIDRRRAEESNLSSTEGLRQRSSANEGNQSRDNNATSPLGQKTTTKLLPMIGGNLRELLRNDR